jgi:hypothetical protein
MFAYNPIMRNTVMVNPAPRIKLFEMAGVDISMGLVGSGVGVSGIGVSVGSSVGEGVLLGRGVRVKGVGVWDGFGVSDSIGV